MFFKFRHYKMNVNAEDSLEEGEILSPCSSPRRKPHVSRKAPVLLKKEKRKHRRRRSRSHLCSHCGKEEGTSNVVADDFDQMRNKYFLRLRREKATKKSRDFFSRKAQSSVEKSTRKRSLDTDDDADIEKLRNQALQSQPAAISSQDSEDEFSLRAEALRTALVKKSRLILSKKLRAKSQVAGQMKEPSEPAACDNEGKENESIDENTLREQLLATLSVQRQKKSEFGIARKQVNPLPLNASASKVNLAVAKPVIHKSEPIVKSTLQANTKKLVNLKKTDTGAEQGRIVVRLGVDSSDDESDSEVKTDELVKSRVTEYLLNVRRQSDAKQSSTPEAVSVHLPLPQRLEYCRLKKALAEKEQKLKSIKSNLNQMKPPTPKGKPATPPLQKQTILHVNKLLGILKKEELSEQRSREELARLRMQISFLEQKMLSHASKAAIVRKRLKGLLSSGKLVVPKSSGPTATATKPSPVKPPPPPPLRTTALKNFSSYESPLNHTDCVIDPLRECCPHDLAGECRDPHCIYQHTRTKSNIS